ncbi:hypothetical protein [Pseudomonas sp. ML96]|uniref:hypothetical protein n=1 Tax=Pseudomonas sp. ML96 TaxID=1523503 RepID=UPI0005BBAC4E|nr:hypothetical protein [Pseudomonas sp. ML96]
MIEGSDFVTLVITVVVASFALAFLSELSEVSIGGYVIKLREAKREAEVTISQLRDLLVATFEPQLEMAMQAGGMFGDARASRDSRVDRFLRLVGSIDKAGVTESLKPQIRDKATLLAKLQYARVSDLTKAEAIRFDPGIPLPLPAEVKAGIFKETSRDTVAQLYRLTPAAMQELADDAVEAYSKLYTLAQL